MILLSIGCAPSFDGQAVSPSMAEDFESRMASSGGPTVTVSSAPELNAAISSATPGTTILVTSGSYGALSISNRTNSNYITIAATSDSNPVFTSVRVSASSRWILQGLDVQPRYTSGAATRIAVDLSGSSIIFENSKISYSDSLPSSPSDWMNRTGHGIRMRGLDLIVRNNSLRYVRRGIVADSTKSLISGNTIDSFAADGVRGNGNFNTFEYNTVRDCYVSDPEDHYDGFQAWTTGPGGVGTGTISGVILRGNTIIESTNLSRNTGCELQGIGMFDGTYKDWIIENNVVVTSHWHGIAVYGANNVKVVNNTAMNPYGTHETWIKIVNHKNGTASIDSVVRNCLAVSFPSGGSGVVHDHNLIITRASLADHFVNANAFDFHLKAGSSAIDAGLAILAPSTDRDGSARPAGAGFDLGAYEFGAVFPSPSLAPSLAPLSGPAR
jgi:hypothetical protein